MYTLKSVLYNIGTSLLDYNYFSRSLNIIYTLCLTLYPKSKMNLS